MKLRNLRLALGLAVVALTVGCGSTAGHIARKTGLLPALRSAWVVVEEDFDRGVADGVADGAIDETAAALLKSDANALESGMQTSIEETGAAAEKWPFLEPWAHRGVEDRVDDGEIVPAAAESGHERIMNFSESLLKLEG